MMSHSPSPTGKPLSASVKKSPSLLQAIWKPMLFLAVGLHAALLFMPFGDAKKEIPKVTEQPLTFNRLPDAKPTPQASPKAAPKGNPVVKKTLTPAAPPSRPLTSPTINAPVNPVSSTAASSEEAVEDTALVRRGASTTSDSTTPPPPTPAATPPTPAATVAARPRPDLDDLTWQLVEGLIGLEGRSPEVGEDMMALLPDDSASKFFTDPAKKERQPGLVGIEFVATQKPTDVSENIALLYPDYTFKQLGNYAGGPVYEIKKKEGETKPEDIRYFNLVPGKTSDSTLVILWKQQPPL